MKKIQYIFLIITLFQLGCNTRQQKEVLLQPEGLVPDESTAKKIAEAIWLPIYGNRVLSQKPYNVKLFGDSVWIVEGSLSKSKLGGTAYIEIRKNDCRILKVTHGK